MSKPGSSYENPIWDGDDLYPSRLWCHRDLLHVANSGAREMFRLNDENRAQLIRLLGGIPRREIKETLEAHGPREWVEEIASDLCIELEEVNDG